MNIDPYILTFSAVTVIATIAMGFWSARKAKTASDFFVAGRSVSVGWNASAISGEYLSAASFMGVAGMVMSSGYDALWYPVCYACGYLFLLLFIAGPLRRFGAYTIPDFAEGRFDSPLFRKIAVVFVLFIGFFYTMPQMKGAGTTLAYIFPGMPYWGGVVLVGAVITLNVALGGMKGITLVQAFQYWAKMFAISVPVFVLMTVYGDYGKQLNNAGIKSPQTAMTQPSITGVKEINMMAAGGTNEAILLYGELAEKSIVNAPQKHSSVTPDPRNLYNMTGSRKEVMAKLESYLQTNGIGFVLEQGGKLRVVPFEQSKQALVVDEDRVVRKPLPEKAPQDSAWLSPFGPLTTKAVKAAAASKSQLDSSKRSELSDPLPFIQTKPNLLRDLDQLTESFESRRTPKGSVQFKTGPSGLPLWQVAVTIKHYSGLTDLLCETNLLLKNIVWDSTTLQTPAELVNSLEQELKTQGITLIHANDKEWWAVSNDRAKSYFKPMDTKPYALLYTYSLIIALVCGTAGLPHILVRFYTNPDGVAAKRTTMWVMILIGIFYVFPPVFGVIGRNLMPDLYNGVAGVKGTDGVVLKLPKLLNDKYAPLGSILSGITCAGAFAAFMSTFSGLLVSMTGALAHDVYGRIFRPKSTPEQRMKMFKICAVICGAGAMLLGFLVETFEINKMVGWAFAIAATSYFPLLFLSTWWRGITMKGASIGMLVGGTLSLLVIASTMFADQAAWAKPLGAFYAVHPLLRILAEQPAIWALPLAIGLMIVISKLTSKEIPLDIRMKMLVLHAPEKLGLKQEYIQEHHGAGH